MVIVPGNGLSVSRVGHLQMLPSSPGWSCHLIKRNKETHAKTREHNNNSKMKWEHTDKFVIYILKEKHK